MSCLCGFGEYCEHCTLKPNPTRPLTAKEYGKGYYVKIVPYDWTGQILAEIEDREKRSKD